MKKLTADQWMGVVLALMAGLVLTLSVLDLREGWSGVVPVGSGDLMPAIEGVSLDGTDLAYAAGDTRGKVLLIDFWATWCPPCVKEMPILAEVYGKYAPQGLELVTINGDQAGNHEAQAQLVKRFFEQQRLEVPTILDNGRVQAAYKVQSFPTLFVVGRDGTIRKVFAGLTSKRRIEREVGEALAEAPPPPTPAPSAGVGERGEVGDDS